MEYAYEYELWEADGKAPVRVFKSVIAAYFCCIVLNITSRIDSVLIKDTPMKFTIAAIKDEEEFSLFMD